MSVTSPMTVASTSHLAQIARKAATSSGSTTAIIRSWDSLIRISSGASVESRSGHPVELDVHAAVAGAGQLGGRAREPGATEVLDAG